MKFEQICTVIIIGALLWLWSGNLRIDCSRISCYNTGYQHDE